MIKRKQKGFTLMEILVTVVILSIGLLGLAGLQAKSQQFTYSSYLRSQASILAYDIMDRMRANKTEALLPLSPYTIGINDPDPTGVPNCHTGACTESQFAAFDLSQWRQLVSNRLPSGRSSVTPFDLATGARLYVIEIRWDDSRGVDNEQIFIFRGEL